MSDAAEDGVTAEDEGTTAGESRELLLRTTGLTRTFDGFVAVEEVDFEVTEGELRALIGPNGAGKTTFFNMLTGMLSPTDGTIEFKGEDVTGLSPHEIARRGMTLSFQITSVFPEMTVRENVLGALNGQRRVLNPLTRYDGDADRNAKTTEILERVGLAEHAATPAGDLSHGDQKVLEIALALAGDPELLLLDEPTAGLSASETAAVTDLIGELRGEVTVILIEHDMELVMGLVDTLTVLHNGQVIAEGTPAEIRENEAVQDVYFGRGY